MMVYQIKDIKSSKKILEFKAKDFHDHPKNQFWYLGMSLMLFGFFYLALRYGQYLLSGVVVAVAIAVFRLANLQPSTREIKFNGKGITWGDRFFGYHQLRAFWLTIQDKRTTLYLERLNAAPQISVVIPASATVETATFLEQYLPHHDHRGEPLSDRFNRLLRL
jgi:hypothetical protein